jgi:hypothetical protein
MKPVKPKLLYIIFINPVRTSKRTQHFTIKNIISLTLFKDIMAVYTENHSEHLSTKCRVTDFYSDWYI